MNWNLEEALAYYKKQGAPGDQNALTQLLREIQREFGGIPNHMPKAIAEYYGIKEALILALIRRIPDLKMAEGHILELCGGPNCSKRAKLEAYARTHLPDNTSLKLVPCMRLCGKGPNLRFDGTLYHGADEALLRKLLDSATERRS